MGWYFGDYSLRALYRDKTASETWTRDDGVKVERITLASCIRGMRIHLVFEVQVGAEKQGPWGTTFMVQNGGEDHGWGYKDIGIAADFPLSYLKKLAPAEGEYEVERRAACREYHEREAQRTRMLANLVPGDVLLLRASCTPKTVVYQRKRGKWLYGSGYRLLPKHVKGVERVNENPTKNECAKTRDVEHPYETYINERTGFEWRVLKKYQSPAAEAKNPYARWYLATKSPMTYGEWEYGDGYVKDVKAMGRKVETAAAQEAAA